MRRVHHQTVLACRLVNRQLPTKSNNNRISLLRHISYNKGKGLLDYVDYLKSLKLKCVLRKKVKQAGRRIGLQLVCDPLLNQCSWCNNGLARERLDARRVQSELRCSVLAVVSDGAGLFATKNSVAIVNPGQDADVSNNSVDRSSLI